MLLAIDADEYFIDEEGIAVPSVLPFQSAGIDDDYRYCWTDFSNSVN